MSIIKKIKEAVTRKETLPATLPATLPINDVFVMVTNGVDDTSVYDFLKAQYDVIVKIEDKYYTLKGKEVVIDQKQISPLYDTWDKNGVIKGCKEFEMTKSLSTIVDVDIEQERLDKMGKAFTPECKASVHGLKRMSTTNEQGEVIDCVVDILVLKPNDKDSEIQVSTDYLRSLENANHNLVEQRMSAESTFVK